MLLSYGIFLFLYLFIPGLTSRDNIDDFSFRGASFLRLIIPPAVAGDKYITLPLTREGYEELY